MTDPSSLWVLSVLKDYVWIPLATILVGVFGYFYRHNLKQDERIRDALNQASTLPEEDQEELKELRDGLIKLEASVQQLEKAMLSSNDVEDIFKHNSAVLTHSLKEIATMMEIISKNIEKYSEKSIRNEEQVSVLAKEVDRLRDGKK